MVLVIDTNKKQLNPCRPAEARLLLNKGKAAVFRQYPFTIILKEESQEEVRPLRLKIDPGSKTTGIALVDDATGKVVYALEIQHRSTTISQAITSRRSIRRSRRNRKTRYRPARFNNRTRKEGWIAPSLESRIAHVETWTRRLIQFCPITAMSYEDVKFDTQLMRNPQISDVQYQQGELQGYEVREYLLEKFNRTCSYCQVKEVPLEIDHIVPKSRGGGNSISNLTLACTPCNQTKGNQTADEFGHPDVQKQANAPLRDAAAMNIIRSVLLKRLNAFGLPIETASGGRTKFNRTQQGFEKTHWIDAACVGASTPKKLHIKGIKPLYVKATGHGSRQMCRVDTYGFPRTGPKKGKKHYGFQTGDIVKAVVIEGKKKGTHMGKVAVRTNGFFNITHASGVVQGIKHTYCKLIHKSDGYSYSFLPVFSTHKKAPFKSLVRRITFPPRAKARGFRVMQ